jgi:hypothetical protein
VVSRSQLRGLEVSTGDIQRMLRRRELTRVHDGVFVDHTGEPTWLQRAWAAVLRHEPAALHGTSAMRAEGGPGLRDHDDAGPIHVAVDRQRKLCRVEGVVLHRVAALATRTRWSASPPRLRPEEAVIEVAAAATTDFEAIAVLARAVGSRWTTATRILSSLEQRARVPRRRFLTSVLADIDQGACSTLEVAYLRRVERAHGLPVAGRQVHASSRGPVYRDVEYTDFGVVLELDGRLDHTVLRDRDRDLDRDLDAAVERSVTARLGWGQVVGRPCSTAAKVAALLVAHGWSGSARRCPACP